MIRSEQQFIDSLIDTGRRLSHELIVHTPRILLRLLRKRLRMTQKQLAKRVGIPQSYIAKIESGAKNPTLNTLDKIFRALDCSLTFLIIAQETPDQMLERQAEIAAKKRIKYVAGTMALEEQLPSKNTLQEMIQEEKKRLLHSNTTKIWD